MSKEKFNYSLGMVFSYRESNIVYVSLRSIVEEMSVDCEAIASYFKGGGHINAAGF